MSLQIYDIMSNRDTIDINTNPNPNPKHNFNWQMENSLEQIQLSVCADGKYNLQRSMEIKWIKVVITCLNFMR